MKNGTSSSSPTDEIHDSPINDYAHYEQELQKAQFEKKPYLEVTDTLFNYLTRGNKAVEYFTTGRPGVRVYKAGKRAHIEQIESMSAEDAHNFYTRKEHLK